MIITPHVVTGLRGYHITQVCVRSVNVTQPWPLLIELLSCCCNSLACCHSFTLERTSHSIYVSPSVPRDPFHHFLHTVPPSLPLLPPFISLLYSPLSSPFSLTLPIIYSLLLVSLSQRGNSVLGQFSMGSLGNTLNLQSLAYLKKKKKHLTLTVSQGHTHTASCFSSHQWFRYWCLEHWNKEIFDSGAKNIIHSSLLLMYAHTQTAHTWLA